jgi:tetratricopeptide (TPR) repeat protein
MPIQFPKFVGRDTQLSDIQAQIARRGQTVVVNIAGAGGVGKTSVLRKVRTDYGAQPGKLVTDVIDFSQTVHRVQSWVLEQITTVLPDQFPTYHQRMRDIETLDPLARLYRELEALEAFVEDYNLIAGNHRIILLFDTVELVQGTHLLEFIIELAARMRNTVLLLAGRYNDERLLVERLNASFGPDQVLTFRLGGFSEEEAQLYFEQAIATHLREVHDDLRKNIYLLSDGNPIKIALSLDWLDRDIPLMPEITQMEPAEVEGQSPSDLAALKTRFEHALMDGIRRLESPLYDVTLYMAHLHKRFNRKMLEFFFFPDQKAGTQSEVAAILSYLKELPFVKYVNDDYFVLHDEMARLVQEHVWDSVEDPDKTLRRELSEKACEYYGQELDEFPPSQHCTEQQRVTFWAYSVERMYYKLYANFRSGYHDFERVFERLVDDHRPGLAALAINFLREFADEADFSDLLSCFMDGYYDGGVLLSQQRFREAEKTLIEGESRLSTLLSTLDLQRAGPLDWHLSERLYMIYHQLGFCYRSLGEWERAIQSYNRSLDLALELAQKLSTPTPSSSDEKQALMAQIAETLNSLANVHRLVGDFDEARLLCHTSILLRQCWEPNQVVRSQYVMAMILWEMGGTAETTGYLRQAEQSCPPGDESLQALIKKHRAYIFFRTGLSHLAIPLLNEAESVFRRRGQFSELADTLIMRSRIYRDHPDAIKDELSGRDHMEMAEQYVEEASRISEQIGDRFRLAKCHLTKAFHYYKWSQVDPTQSLPYREKALAHWRQGHELAEGRYYQLSSLYSQVRGDMAFKGPNPDYDVAFEQYIQQCELATRFKRAVFERSIDTLGERLRELGADKPTLAKRYIRNTIDNWSRAPQLNSTYPELIDEVKEIRQAIEEREKLKQLRAEYNLAMLEGRWNEAIENCDSILDIPSLYDDVNRANVILDKIRAAHQLGDLSQARRLAKVVLQIGKDLKSISLTAHGHLSLAQVLWDTTSTAEAATHLDLAEAAFREIDDEIGLARVTRLRSYILFRTGFFKEPQEQLQRIAEVFERNEMVSELADVLNILSRIARTDPQNPDYDQARRWAQQALQTAQAIGDSYRVGECYVSLAILAYREQNYDRVLQYYKDGLAWLSPETHLLRVVYHGIRGAALLRMGLAVDPPARVQYWDQAFNAFVLDLIEATKSKPASLVRAVGLVYGFIMFLPPTDVQTYAQRVKDAWQGHQLDQDFSIVMRMCDQAVRYRPYVETSSA